MQLYATVHPELGLLVRRCPAVCLQLRLRFGFSVFASGDRRESNRFWLF